MVPSDPWMVSALVKTLGFELSYDLVVYITPKMGKSRPLALFQHNLESKNGIEHKLGKGR